LAQVSLAQVSGDQIGLAKVGRNQIGLAKVGLAKVSLDVWILFSPFVPGLNTILRY